MNGDRAKEFEVHCTDEFTLKLSPSVLPIHFIFCIIKIFSSKFILKYLPQDGASYAGYD